MRRITFPLYVGGFLGPFGGAMVAALIPSIARRTAPGRPPPTARSSSSAWRSRRSSTFPSTEVDTRLPFLVAAGFSALLAVSVAPWFERYR